MMVIMPALSYRKKTYKPILSRKNRPAEDDKNVISNLWLKQILQGYYLSNGRVPYRCAALFTAQVEFRITVIRKQIITKNETIGHSSQAQIGITTAADVRIVNNPK